jgi:disulfide oxidoreductase YuzD
MKEKFKVLPMEWMNIGEVKTNVGQYKDLPKNPRVIKNDKFRKLVKSIKDLPEMLEIRPIVVNENSIVLGGNMRLKACQEIGLESIPVIKIMNLDIEKQKEFIVKDNVSFGQWDLDEVFNKEWNIDFMQMWGAEIENKKDEDLTDEELESKYDNSNCLYPLIPIYDEQYNAIIIICETRTELANVRSKLNITEKRQSYKNKFIGETNVITAKELLRNEKNNS